MRVPGRARCAALRCAAGCAAPRCTVATRPQRTAALKLPPALPCHTPSLEPLQSPGFWVLVAALRRFIEGEGKGLLPLEVRGYGCCRFECRATPACLGVFPQERASPAAASLTPARLPGGVGCIAAGQHTRHARQYAAVPRAAAHLPRQGRRRWAPAAVPACSLPPACLPACFRCSTSPPACPCRVSAPCCRACCRADAAAVEAHARAILEGAGRDPAAIPAADIKHFCKHARYLRCVVAAQRSAELRMQQR